jgi:predicted membrane channel-forming protein YqfA (hemolysin III family)
MKTKNPTLAMRFQLCGWILFIVSAVFFIASSIRAGDMLSLTGGLFFLVACLVFMIPLLSNWKIESRAAKLVTNN